MITTTTKTANVNYIYYIYEKTKASRRNARVKDERRELGRKEEDIPETARMRAHLQRRIERQTKCRWMQYANECFYEIENSGPREREAMTEYLENLRKEGERKGFLRERRNVQNLKG